MNRKNIYYWLLLPVLALMMGACGESNNDEELSKPDTPVTPVNPGDWQTVPAKGGTIEKGDIALTFPAGTFDADTKVAITEVKKGSVGGECEVSPFYQLTVSNATNKPITVKMKAKETDDGNAEFMVQSPAYSISQNQDVTNECTLETNYIGGEYTASIPTLNEPEDENHASFTIGLCRNPYIDTDETRQVTRASDSSDPDYIEGETDSVKWKAYINYSKLKDFNEIQYRHLKKNLSNLKECIKSSIEQIHELGIEWPRKDVRLNYRIESMGEGKFGCFNANFLSRHWDCITVNAGYVLNPQDFRILWKTIMHETLHNYQSYYNPGWAPNPLQDNCAMYEMGAVWIEKFTNDGKLDGFFQVTSGLLSTFKNNFRVGIPRELDEVWGLYGTGTPYAEMGYAMAPLLYYMISKNYSRGFTDKSVASLYTKYWKKVSNGYCLIDILNEWYNETFKEHFFNDQAEHEDNLSDYYLALWKGDLMDYFNFYRIAKGAEEKETYAEGVVIEKLSEKNSTLKLNGTVYPYGCEGMLFQIDPTSFTEDILKEKEMVIKEKNGHKTFLLYKDGEKNLQYSKMIESSTDSITVSGEFLAELQKRNKNKTVFFLLTVKDDTGGLQFKNTNYAYKTESSVELRDAKKKDTTFERLNFWISMEYTYTYTTKKETKTEESGYSCDIDFQPEQFKTTKKGGNTYTVTAKSEINGIQYSLTFSYKDEGRDRWNQITMSDIKDMEFSAIPVSDDAKYIYGAENQHEMVSFKIGNDSPGVEYDYYDEDNYGNRYLSWFISHAQLSDVTITYINPNKSNVVFKNAMISVKAYYEFHKYH